MLCLLSVPGFVPTHAATAAFKVTPLGPSNYQGDFNHNTFKTYFNVTNTGTALDYVTIPRSGITILLSPGQQCPGQPGPSGLCEALGLGSPEFGVSLPPVRATRCGSSSR